MPLSLTVTRFACIHCGISSVNEDETKTHEMRCGQRYHNVPLHKRHSIDALFEALVNAVEPMYTSDVEAALVQLRTALDIASNEGPLQVSLRRVFALNKRFNNS